MSAIDPRDALAQPTRARIYARLRERAAAATTDELAGELGLHPNGVRTHLGRLLAAGLVERARDREGPGRPADRWSVAREAVDPAGGAGPYADLSRWLTRTIAARATTGEQVEAVGRAIGRQLLPAARRGDPAGQLRDALAALGFRPRERTAPAGEWHCTLDRCPYREAADDPERLVCTLHRGITGGLVEAIAPSAALVAFEPRDPARAGCVVAVTGLPT
ncbi:helix-turn-helix transcriptional regulator [Patulibacter defluvii]|uniref:helix-turn-helix transcriptional regulator n=1 Tax=Patulibacter defluvii TaxID=3095358 RepID=UPI002A75A683|nr:helix-turn-helix domain-containing protein [Patulibacter sp. DM4]